MNEVEDQLVALARRLMRATLRGSIVWKVEDETHFQYDTADSSVVIRSVNDDGQSPYVMELFDGKGVLAEEMRSQWYQDPDDVWNQLPMDKNAVLADLYRAARRKAKNVDAVISSLLSSLDEDDLF